MRATQYHILLQQKNFKYFWLSQCFYLLGTWVQQTAINWMVATTFAKTSEILFFNAICYLPLLILLLPAGSLADRCDCKKIITVTYLLFALIAMLYAFMLHTNILQKNILYFFGLSSAAITAIHIPASQSLSHTLVASDYRAQAVSLNLSSLHAIKLIAPQIASLFLINFLLPLPTVFILNSLCLLIVLGFLSKICYDKKIISMPLNAAFIKEGFYYIRHTPTVASLIFLNFLASFFILPILLTFAPANMHLLNNFNEQTMAILMSSSGLGAMIGAFVTGAHPIFYQKIVIFLLILFTSAALYIASISKSILIFSSSMLFLSFGISAIQSTFSALLQTLLPEKIKGRVLAINIFIFNLAMPTATFLFGFLSTVIGLRIIFIICASGYCVGSISVLYYRGFLKGDQSCLTDLCY